MHRTPKFQGREVKVALIKCFLQDTYMWQDRFFLKLCRELLVVEYFTRVNDSKYSKVISGITLNLGSTVLSSLSTPKEIKG